MSMVVDMDHPIGSPADLDSIKQRLLIKLKMPLGTSQDVIQIIAFSLFADSDMEADIQLQEKAVVPDKKKPFPFKLLSFNKGSEDITLNDKE